MVLKLVNNLKKNKLSIIKFKGLNQSNNYNLNKIKKIDLYLTLNKLTGDLFLNNPSSYKNLISPHNWLKYNEPEDHIKKITKIYEKNFPVNKKFVLGITYKDESFLNNLNKKKIKKKYIIDPETDLGLKKNKGVECIQNKLSNLKKINFDNHKKPDLIVARHIWEHFYDQEKFVIFLKNISTEETIFYFEIPDCEKSIKNYDYSMIWEEHVHYYSMNTFLTSLERLDFEIIKYGRYKYPYEDVLYAFFKLKKSSKKIVNKIDNDVRHILSYGKKFEKISKNLTKKFKLIKKSGNIGVIGASHMANTVISFFKLENYISSVFDGNKDKIGRYYFKNRIKILDINGILKENCKHFIIAINPMHKKFIKEIKKKLSKNKKSVSILFSKKFYLDK